MQLRETVQLNRFHSCQSTKIGSIALVPVIGVVVFLLMNLSVEATQFGVPFNMIICAVTPRTSEAIGLVREERTRIKAEKKAFKRLIRQINTIEPATQRSISSASSVSSMSQIASVSSSSPNPETTAERSLQNIRDMYRQTVMDVSHYEEEYAESIEQHLTKEFGPELTRAMMQEGHLLPPVQKELLEQCRIATQERVVLLQSVDRELDSLTDTKRTIRKVDEEILSVEDSLYPSTIPTIIQGWKKLDVIEREIKKKIKQRQATINAKQGEMPPHTLQQYLYQSQPWTYPSLLDGLKMVRQIGEARDLIVEELYDW